MPFTTVNNIRMYYELHGEGEPLFFIHGLGSSHRDFEFQVNFFSKHYQIITFDLRGHGQSDKPDEPYTVPLFAKDCAELIKKFSPEPVNIVGHSLGGMIAFQLVVDFPQLVKTLTILNSAPAVVFPGLKEQMGFHLRSLSVRLFGMKKLSVALAHKLFPKPEQTHLRDLFITRWMENDPKAYINTLHAFSGWNIMDRIREIHCPTLIVAADGDYTPVSTKEFYLKQIPNAELAVIRDSGHFSIFDQPDIFNQALFMFLRKNGKNPHSARKF